MVMQWQVDGTLGSRDMDEKTVLEKSMGKQVVSSKRLKHYNKLHATKCHIIGHQAHTATH